MVIVVVIVVVEVVVEVEVVWWYGVQGAMLLHAQAAWRGPARTRRNA